jgi:hypothetical protein
VLHHQVVIWVWFVIPYPNELVGSPLFEKSGVAVRVGNNFGMARRRDGMTA